MSTIETLATFRALELKAESDGQGIIEGYASYFGERDQGGDVVVRGAFRRSLQERKAARLPMLFGHIQTTVPLGVWTELREDGVGLRVKGQMVFETPEARQVFAVMKAGGEMGISIGFKTLRKEMETQPGKDGYDEQTRKLLEVDLREISLVPLPMLDNARVLSVKSEAAADDDQALIRAFLEASETAAIEAALRSVAARL